MELCASNGRLPPGFRFHPTNVELVVHYLKRKVLGKRLSDVIREVNIYQYHPKDLRELSSMKKDLNWYFFCTRWKKYGNGDRTNRATPDGYWKATGVDRVVSYQDRTVGKIKTLIFHEGKPPKGKRTDWVMHEYVLDDKNLADKGICQGSYALCKIFEKGGWGPRNGAQYGAPFIEEEWDDDDEILNRAQAVQIGNNNQSTSVVTNPAVTNILVPVNASAASTSEQVYSGALSAVDQAPTQVENAAATAISNCAQVVHIGNNYQSANVVICSAVNATATAAIIASSSNGLPGSDYPLDQVHTPITVAGNMVPSSNGSVPNYSNPVVVETSTPMPKATDIALTSAGPLPNNDDDDIFRLLDGFQVVDRAVELGSLQYLDGNWSARWQKMSEDEGGLELADLDLPL